MNTYKMMVQIGSRSPITITIEARDWYQAKDLAKRMYGNDIKFYQYTIN